MASNRQLAADIVRDAGGRIVGRTKLQKVAFLLELVGLGSGFSFEYKHYGPYSEELTAAIREAAAFDLVQTTEQSTSWGGWYSVYSTTSKAVGSDRRRIDFAAEASKVGSVELELAATAAYLAAMEGYRDPWDETRRRKADKAANGRLERAQDAYRQLTSIATPTRLPDIV
ncbi:MAG TPA: hypothetical protein VHZ78_05090 [Rhizomicrobium sp.]|jgi:uncharacterized protein YwgA|nr:hypothetical protein [Rhizomicrobium sp.]